MKETVGVGAGIGIRGTVGTSTELYAAHFPSAHAVQILCHLCTFLSLRLFVSSLFYLSLPLTHWRLALACIRRKSAEADASPTHDKCLLYVYKCNSLLLHRLAAHFRSKGKEEWRKAKLGSQM